MTTQEAIEILKIERDHMTPTLLTERTEAMNMAISALKEQDLQPTCNNLATDTISRKEGRSYGFYRLDRKTVWTINRFGIPWCTCDTVRNIKTLVGV